MSRPRRVSCLTCRNSTQLLFACSASRHCASTTASPPKRWPASQDKLPFGELLQRLLIEADRTIDNREIGIALLCESVVLVFGAIEAICVCRYFKLELSEGTPFTETGAKSITKLGILFIVVDVLSAAFSSAMEKFAFISERMDNGGGIGIGICLILLAMVVRYGAELEQRGRAK